MYMGEMCAARGHCCTFDTCPLPYISHISSAVAVEYGVADRRLLGTGLRGWDVVEQVL